MDATASILSYDDKNLNISNNVSHFSLCRQFLLYKNTLCETPIVYAKHKL